jgi:hypothetical protein
MVAVVSIETVLLVLLVVLVAGLLRSHAEILRRLGPAEDTRQRGTSAGRGVDHEAPISPPAASRSRGELRAPALAGTMPDGGAAKLDFEGAAPEPTLLAFLSTGCSTCAGFWESLGERRLPPGVRTVIVTHGSERERPSRLRSLAPSGIPVVMSTRAWEDFGVPGAPYFVLVDGVIRGEGVATTWQALASLVRDAIEDQRAAERSGGGDVRARRVDEVLAAAGIGPGDPSLYPGRARAATAQPDCEAAERGTKPQRNGKDRT